MPQVKALARISAIYKNKLRDEGTAKKYYAKYFKAGGKNPEALVAVNNAE